MAGDELARRGWHLTSEGQDQCVENGNKSADSITKKALNLDLRDIGEKWLPADLSTGRVKVDYLEGPSVLQVLKSRNISAPKDNEESQAAPRLWKITLTDGHANVVAICLEPLRNISPLTPPGTKLLLEGTVDVESTYLLLTNKNARLLGGRVPSLVESWELKRKLAQQSRQGIQSEGGPPPYVPFGKKISNVEVPRRDNFKSLAASKQSKEEEDSEFQQQRQATIAEALTAKTKTFGGGQKQNVNDRDVARIVEMGFTPDQAFTALRQCGGNANDAIGGLINGNFGGRDSYGRGGGRAGGRGGGGPRDRGEQRFEDDHEESRRGGRGGRGGGRRGRGEEEEDSVSGRPSGPATLFDFLETKIPSKSENQRANNQRVSSGSAPKFSSNQQAYHKPYSSSSDQYSSRGPSHFNSGPSRSQTNSTSSYRGGGPSHRDGAASFRSSDSNHHSSNSDSGYRSSNHGGVGGRDSRGGEGTGGEGPHNDDFNHGRRQQNLPPRLAHKLGRDNGGPQMQGSSRPNSGRSQDNGSDNRTRYSGGDTNLQGANENNRKALREQNSDNKSMNSAGGYNDQKQLQQSDHQSNNQRVQGGAGQKPRYDQQRQQQQGRRHDGPPRPVWQRGQTVLAKYWEDEQLYRAVVEAVAENGVTAVVTFMDYGNQEEVLCSDIHPLAPQQNWNNSYPPPPPQGAPLMSTPGFFPGYGPPNMAAPPPFPGQEGFGSGPIPNMEFRRGGSGPTHRRQEQTDRRRPTQNYYMPPSRKKEG